MDKKIKALFQTLGVWIFGVSLFIIIGITNVFGGLNDSWFNMFILYLIFSSGICISAYGNFIIESGATSPN